MKNFKCIEELEVLVIRIGALILVSIFLAKAILHEFAR